MTPELLPEPEPQPKGLGEGSRLTGVFFEPAKTFADVAERPGFWVPLILIMVFSVCYMVLFGQHVGWERMMRHQFETSSQMAQMSPEQREQSVQMAAKYAPISGYVGVLLGVPLGTLLWAAVLLGIAKGMMSAQVRLKQVFAIICYSGMPGLIMVLLAIAVMFLKRPDDFPISGHRERHDVGAGAAQAGVRDHLLLGDAGVDHGAAGDRRDVPEAAGRLQPAEPAGLQSGRFYGSDGHLEVRLLAGLIARSFPLVAVGADWHRAEGGGREDAIDGWGNGRGVPAVGDLDIGHGGAVGRFHQVRALDHRAILPAATSGDWRGRRFRRAHASGEAPADPAGAIGSRRAAGVGGGALRTGGNRARRDRRAGELRHGLRPACPGHRVPAQAAARGQDAGADRGQRPWRGQI